MGHLIFPFMYTEDFRIFPTAFFGWLGPDPAQLVLCTVHAVHVSFLADFIASWKTVH